VKLTEMLELPQYLFGFVLPLLNMDVVFCVGTVVLALLDHCLIDIDT